MNDVKRLSGKTSGKTVKNTVGVQVVKGMIRLSLPRAISRTAYGIEQKFIFPGLEATPLNIKLMEGKASVISVDIATGNFDVTLEKYQLGVAVVNKLIAISGGKKESQLSMLQMYDKYCESKKGKVAETTLEIKFKNKYRNAVVAAIEAAGEDALKIQAFLLENRCKDTAKRALSCLSESYKLGIKHKYAVENPFEGMAEDIRIFKGRKITADNFDDENEDSDVRAFSVEEMNFIIDAFESSSRRKHLAPIIKFLFWTGCRTGEAIGLKWRDINWDNECIKIRRTYNSELKIFKPTKTNTIRIFPMPKNGQLWNLLKLLPVRNFDDVVFPSKMGKILEIRSLGTVWRGSKADGNMGVIPRLITQGKVKQYLKLYATRHTFISHQINIYKIPVSTVAGWVGNGAMVSYNDYLDRDRVTVPCYSFSSSEVPSLSKLAATTDNQLPDAIVNFVASLTPEQIEYLKVLLDKQ